MRSRSYPLLFIFLVLALAGCGDFFTPRNDNTTPAAAKFAYVANFSNATSGSISVFTMDATTGALTSNGAAVSTGSSGLGPAALTTVAGNFLYSANDSGTVSAFSINSSTGALTGISGSPFATGSGTSNPNAIVADPSGKFLYVANSGSNDISAFTIDSTSGSLTAISGSPFLTGSSSATAGAPTGLAVHPGGKFLYATVDVDGIAVFTINTTTGALTFSRTVAPQSGGKPQAIAIEKSGKFAYAADGNTGIEEFSIDTTTGNLTALSGSPVSAGSVPIVITSDAAGKFVYAASQGSNNVFAFGILTDGSLTPLAGNPVAAGTSPSAIAIEPAGKFLYVTNFSGSPDVSIYSIDTTGKLTSAGSASSGTNPAAIAFH